MLEQQLMLFAGRGDNEVELTISEGDESTKVS